jgi:hypothetical protein
MTRQIHRIIVIGLDGLEPTIVAPMLEAGTLPHLAQLRQRGGYSRLGTTWPAQTPTAWSTFATGTNPGGHGVFDFIRRDPQTYLPNLALNRYEQKNPFIPPKAVNLRGGTPLWSVLSNAGLASTGLAGDLVRNPLSSELGFSKEHRDINIRRIGWVASAITKNGGIAVCAPIAPYHRIPRRHLRDGFPDYGWRSEETRDDATLSITPKNQWDIAAGVLLAPEAGGRVTDLDGPPCGCNEPDTLVPGIIATTAMAFDLVSQAVVAVLGSGGAGFTRRSR